jgi:hypothetical protein
MSCSPLSLEASLNSAIPDFAYLAGDGPIGSTDYSAQFLSIDR